MSPKEEDFLRSKDLEFSTRSVWFSRCPSVLFISNHCETNLSLFFFSFFTVIFPIADTQECLVNITFTSKRR